MRLVCRRCCEAARQRGGLMVVAWAARPAAAFGRSGSPRRGGGGGPPGRLGRAHTVWYACDPVARRSNRLACARLMAVYSTLITPCWCGWGAAGAAPYW